MFPVMKLKFIFGVLAIMAIGSHMGHAVASSDQSQDEANMENTALLPQEQEDHEITVEASNDMEKRKIRIRCRCWIGWLGKESIKYVNFGVIRKFKLLEFKKHAKCSASCSAKCAPYFVNTKKNYDFLCKKIGKPYNHKSKKVGCFSKVGKFDTHNNLWDFDGAPHKLCCKRFRKNCSVYGPGFYWHHVLKLCVQYLSPGIPQYGYCIPNVPNGPKKPPVCCYNKKVYACQKAKYYISSVKC